jgi:hypothetical protein
VHVEPKYGYELHPIYTKASGDSAQVTTASWSALSPSTWFIYVLLFSLDLFFLETFVDDLGVGLKSKLVECKPDGFLWTFK